MVNLLLNIFFLVYEQSMWKKLKNITDWLRISVQEEWNGMMI